MSDNQTSINDNQTLDVNTNYGGQVQFKLNPSVLEGEAIEVSSGYFQTDSEKPVSIKKLTPQEIRSSPGSGEDIFRIIQSMPGVSRTGSASANLIVRGGAPDENLTLLENVEIYNPLHFARAGTSMGAISIINPALLQGVEFMTGGFPARYGDKMSSVFEMKLKDGNKTHFNKDIDINLAGFGVMLDGPVSDNGNVVVSLRRGFFDLITNLMDKPLSPRYWDAVGKYTLQPSERHMLSFLGFYYNDEFTKDGYTEGAQFKLGKRYPYVKRDITGSAIGINWRYLLNSNGYVLTTASFTRNSWKSWLGSELIHDLAGDDVDEKEFHLRSELTYKLSDSFELKAGAVAKSIHSDNFTWTAADTINTGHILPADTLTFNPDPTYKAGIFVQSTMRPIKFLQLNAGLRFDYFDFTKERELSPRLSASVFLTDRITLSAAYGHYYQTPATYQVALDPQNTNLKSSRSVHYIAGIGFLLDSDTKLSVEGFYKELDDTFVKSDTSRIITNNGSGYAQGVEFFLQKKMSRNFVGSLAYTWSLSRRKDADFLPEYDFDYDQRHNLTMIAGYKLSNYWRIGAKFQYGSGMPYTPAIGTKQVGDRWHIIQGEKNSERIPDYHQLDIRVDRVFHFSNWTLTAYLDVWNVYNQENVLFYTFDTDEKGNIIKEVNYDFTIMPIVGFSAKF